MERFTKWNGKKWTLPQGRTSEGESNWRRIADRLAAYENTGLEPEEIELLKRSIMQYKYIKVDKIKDPLSERDGLWYVAVGNEEKKIGMMKIIFMDTSREVCMLYAKMLKEQSTM